MNSVCFRFIIQRFILHGVLLFFVPIAACLALEAPSEEALESKVARLILEQWHALGQREDSTSKVLIKGIPSGYQAPGRCSEALTIMMAKQLRPGNNSIEVNCIHRRSWSLMLNADIEVWRDVVVLRDHIARGERITHLSLVLQKRDIADLQRGYFTSFAEVANNVSKRSLRAGATLNPSMVNLPILVKRGQAITLRVKRIGFSVDMKGLALKKGRQGEKIKVKNSSSGKTLYGTIVSPDLVLVD
jgi:flagella basal body P-ring formation protein FlgA